MNNEEKIKYLSEDAAFGILTRPSLELEMSEATAPAVLYIIDFDNIHKMNMTLGYDKVNSIMVNTYSFLDYSFYRCVKNTTDECIRQLIITEKIAP